MQRAQGVLLMCAGVASLSVNDVIAKALTADYSPMQVLFLRNLLALPFAMLIAWKIGGRNVLISHGLGAHLLRGALWISATYLYFSSLRYLPLAQVTALVFVAPLFIMVLSGLVLGERVGKLRWLAVLAGFAGGLIVVRPGGATFDSVALLPIGAAFLYAVLMLGARWLDARESVWTVLLYLTGTGTVLSGLVVPFDWTPIRAADLWLFLGIALVGTAGITMMTEAFRRAPAPVVAPLEYAAILWATFFGWMFWGEIPDRTTLVGAAIVIASGIALFWQEGRARPGAAAMTRPGNLNE